MTTCHCSVNMSQIHQCLHVSADLHISFHSVLGKTFLASIDVRRNKTTRLYRQSNTVHAHDMTCGELLCLQTVRYNTVLQSIFFRVFFSVQRFSSRGSFSKRVYMFERHSLVGLTAAEQIGLYWRDEWF